MSCRKFEHCRNTHSFVEHSLLAAIICVHKASDLEVANIPVSNSVLKFYQVSKFMYTLVYHQPALHPRAACTRPRSQLIAKRYCLLLVGGTLHCTLARAHRWSRYCTVNSRWLDLHSDQYDRVYTSLTFLCLHLTNLERARRSRLVSKHWELSRRVPNCQISNHRNFIAYSRFAATVCRSTCSTGPLARCTVQ